MQEVAGHSGVGVLVPAAGSGTRMGGERKQSRLLGGRPLLVQTLLLFEHHPDVRAIVVAAPVDCVVQFREELLAAGISKAAAVVQGGATRQDSVRSALQALPAGCDLVLVHDAVRPFVKPEQISGVIAAVAEHGAAALAIPVTDTLRRGEDGAFDGTVPREGLYRMQTPQGFRRSVLEEAFRAADRSGFQATDDVALVTHLGHPVRIVEGGYENLKITTPGDWELAQALWPTWEARVFSEAAHGDSLG